MLIPLGTILSIDKYEWTNSMSNIENQEIRPTHKYPFRWEKNTNSLVKNNADIHRALTIIHPG